MLSQSNSSQRSHSQEPVITNFEWQRFYCITLPIGVNVSENTQIPILHQGKNYLRIGENCFIVNWDQDKRAWFIVSETDPQSAHLPILYTEGAWRLCYAEGALKRPSPRRPAGDTIDYNELSQLTYDQIRQRQTTQTNLNNGIIREAVAVIGTINSLLV